jgi:hypothetical protein
MPPIGWGLLLNRYTLGALAIAAAAIAGAAWWSSTKAGWIAHGQTLERGAQAIRQAEADRKHRAQVAGFVVDLSKREAAALARLAAAEGRADLVQGRGPAAPAPQLSTLILEVRPNVTTHADIICSLTRGFVREHDARVPAPDGFPRLSPGGPDVDQPATVSLARAAAVIRHNYTEAQRAVARLAACETRRFEACLAWDAAYGTHSGCELGNGHELELLEEP